jgi:WD40 repeat protein
VTACAIAPDGRRVVSASEDKTLKIWDLETGRELGTLQGRAAGVTACAVTPDGRRVVSASYDQTLKVWDLDSGRELSSLQGHASWVTACVVTPDGRRVVSASADQTLKVWDLETGACLLTHRANAAFSAVTTTATTIITGDATGAVWFLSWPPTGERRTASSPEVVHGTHHEEDPSYARRTISCQSSRHSKARVAWLQTCVTKLVRAPRC